VATLRIGAHGRCLAVFWLIVIVSTLLCQELYFCSVLFLLRATALTHLVVWQGKYSTS
jgi:hypothetical protein